MTPLPRSFYARDAVPVARDLLGATLVRILPSGALLVATIVETEAYRRDDPASHSHRGPTNRNRSMFGPPGNAYVYVIYGMYDCLNAVCEATGEGAAVLIRALEPRSGIEIMWANRFPDDVPPRWLRKDPMAEPDRLVGLMSGPGKLCRALAIRRADHDGTSLTDPVPCDRAGSDRIVVTAPGEAELRLLPGRSWPLGENAIDTSSRIGITKATDRPWRFLIAGNRFVSAATGRSGRPSPR